MSFVPNLEACHCLLLIFDASFDILFTFISDMQRKHLYQSVSCRPSVVRMSGLPCSLYLRDVDSCTTNRARSAEQTMSQKSPYVFRSLVLTLYNKIYICIILTLS